MLESNSCEPYIEGNTPYDFSGATARSPATGQFANPFVPLDSNEITTTVANIKLTPEYIAFKAQNPDRPGAASSLGVIFSFVTLQEPQKSYVNSWTAAQGTKRVAQTLVYGLTTNNSVQFLTDMNSGNIFRIDTVRVIPPIDFFADPPSTIANLIPLLQSDPQVQVALQKRNLNAADIGTSINVFPNSFESLVELGKEHKCCQELVTVCDGNNRLFYLAFAKPYPTIIDGLLVVVDATNQTIYKVIDEFVVPLPISVFDPVASGKISHPLKNPIHITQPAGPSYTLSSNEITWDNWKLKYSWHPRTGVQLYDIKYTDNGGSSYRDIMYKLSIDESGVYYNVQKPLYARGFLSADSDSYPLLARIRPMIPGLDAPAYATFVNIPISNPDGSIATLQNAFAIYEQLGKISYRSKNFGGCNQNPGCVDFPEIGVCLGDQFICSDSGSVDQELVIRFYFSGILYLWTYTYIFSPSGSIRIDIDVSARVFSYINQTPSPWGQLITKNRLAFNHTHYWNIRADFKVDGENNTVVESNQFKIPSSDQCNENSNICGQTVKYTEKHLETELQAIRNHKIKTNRKWTVHNPNKQNRLGYDVGYEILPLLNLNKSLANDESWVHKNYSFLNNTLHVTKYNDQEQFAAGNFPIMVSEDIGLGKYVKKDANIENTDIVLWYTIIYSHAPHSEDHPMVPTKSASLLFTPENFFEINPAYGLKQLIGK